MRLTGPQIKDLLDLFRDAFLLGELTLLVRVLLEEDIDCIVAPGDRLDDRIYKIINWAERHEKFDKLATGIMHERPDLKERLSKIIAETREVMPKLGDPFAPFFPFKEPFVDRAVLETGLEMLWDANGRGGVLVVRGRRHSGRTQSWFKIRMMAAHLGVEAWYVDISRDPAGYDVPKLVDLLTKWMKVPRTAQADSKAQESRAGVNFAASLKGHIAEGNMRGTRWCLVLDGLDRIGVSEALREFVESIAVDVLAQNLPNLSLILLGYGPTEHLTFQRMILKEDIAALCPKHVREFLHKVMATAEVRIPDDVLDQETEKVFEGLPQELDLEAMDNIAKRVKEYTYALLRRQP